MAKEPFLPLFFGDFLASTAEWEGEEQALYLLLLGYQWSLGTLPAEPRRLCKLAGWDWALFERCWPTVSTKFPVKDGRLANDRLEKHRARSREISEKRANAGAIGGSVTQANAKQMLESSKAIASTLLSHPSHPIPSQSDPEPEPEKNKKPDRRTARAADEPDGFVSIRIEYPKRSGGQRWGDALKFYARRIAEGTRPEDILAGVKRYAAYTRATGIERTEKVQQAATFLGDNRGYLELWQPPPRALSPVERVQQRMAMRNGNGDERVVSEQFGESGSGVAAPGRVLRRFPDS
jgi:uncharacterized protein YdaU (DUF1376 family)